MNSTTVSAAAATASTSPAVAHNRARRAALVGLRDAGIFAMARTLEALESGEYTIEEIDAVTGPALGRPRSATFRTMDIAGLDVLIAHRMHALIAGYSRTGADSDPGI